jgi:S1-C subfamily serine protease
VTTAPSDPGHEHIEPTVGTRRRANRWWWLTPLALGLLGSVAGLLLFTTFQPARDPKANVNIEAVVATAVAKAADAPARSAVVFREILPSLVFIRTDGKGERADSSGVGSGVIINEDGSILTANHVVEGARSITVTFADGKEAKAKVVSAQPQNDLAVLQADGAPGIIVPAVLAGVGRIGDEAFAVGNPLGLAASFSAGVISGLDRTIPLPPNASRPGSRSLSGLIQFDAAVNPGSSGGPLLNRNGQVIGIVTALATPSNQDSFTGIGFAVPLSAAGSGAGGPPR